MELKTYLILPHADFLNGVVQERCFFMVHTTESRSFPRGVDVAGDFMNLGEGLRPVLVRVRHDGRSLQRRVKRRGIPFVFF